MERWRARAKTRALLNLQKRKKSKKKDWLTGETSGKGTTKPKARYGNSYFKKRSCHWITNGLIGRKKATRKRRKDNGKRTQVKGGGLK